MTTVLNLILLPLRAPMLLVLLLISTYLGLHWSHPGAWADVGMRGVTDLIWSAECLQALVVVVVCTMPDLLLRRISSIMAASRVASLVITLLLVVTGGLYLLHLDVLSNVLILASTVMLTRLDLVRLRVVPPPFVMTLILGVLVLGGITLGRSLELQMRPYLQLPQEEQPASLRQSERPAADGQRAPVLPAEAPKGQNAAKASSSREGTQSGGRVKSSSPENPAAGSKATAAPKATPGEGNREPDRAIPHLQTSGESPPER